MRKQLEPFGFDNFDPHAKSQPIDRGLGWATPGAEPISARSELIESKSDGHKRRHEVMSAGGGSEQLVSMFNCGASSKPR